MNVAVCITTDGRDHLLSQAIASICMRVILPNGRYVSKAYVVDDSGRAHVELPGVSMLEFVECVRHVNRMGFAQTVRDVWTLALTDPDVTHIFHAEDDFTYNQDVDLGMMADILADKSLICQVTLKRDCVNLSEEEAGGFMQTWDASVWGEDVTFAGGQPYVAHWTNFTSNPSLIPRDVIERLLAMDAPLTEPNMTKELFSDDYIGAYVGRYMGLPLVTHIGSYRSEGWAE